MHRVLALQEDFQSEKPLMQSIIEDAGHICIFLPRFHCELNPIEMLWGYGKHRTHFLPLFLTRVIITSLSGYRNLSDGRFPTAKLLVPQCLDVTNKRLYDASSFLLFTYVLTHIDVAGLFDSIL